MGVSHGMPNWNPTQLGMVQMFQPRKALLKLGVDAGAALDYGRMLFEDDESAAKHNWGNRPRSWGHIWVLKIKVPLIPLVNH